MIYMILVVNYEAIFSIYSSKLCYLYIIIVLLISLQKIKRSNI